MTHHDPQDSFQRVGGPDSTLLQHLKECDTGGMRRLRPVGRPQQAQQQHPQEKPPGVNKGVKLSSVASAGAQQVDADRELLLDVLRLLIRPNTQRTETTEASAGRKWYYRPVSKLALTDIGATGKT